MNEQEAKLAAKVAVAINTLPQNKQEYMIGYAEGIIAARKAQEERT